MNAGALHGILGVPLALLALFAVLDSSLRIAGRMLAGSRLVTIAVATVVVAHAQLLLVFELLGVFGAFRLPFVLGAFLAIAIACRRLPAVEISGRAFFASMSTPTRVLACAVVLLLVTKALRAAVAPTLAMDGTVYHIPRAVLWLRSGGFARLGAPDALEITDFHPPAGDLPWAYALLFARNESLVGFASVAVVIEAFVAAYAAARLMAAERTAAIAAGLAIVCTPAVMVYAGSSYVDNAVLTFALSGIALLIDAIERPGFGRALLTSAALTLAACSKVSATVLLPVVALAGTIAAWRSLDRRWFFGWLAGTVLIAPHVVRCIVLRGSPTYPIGLTLFGHQLFRPNETFELLASGKLFPPQVDDPVHFAGILLTPYLRPLDTTGFGPALVPIAALGVVGAARSWRERRVLVVLLLGIAALFLGAIWSPTALAYRTEWALHTARYLTVAVAALALLAATARGRWVEVTLFGCAALSLLCSIPRGLGMIDLLAIAPVAIASAAVLGLVFMLRKKPRWVLIVAVSGAWLAHLVALGSRAANRDPYLAELARRSIYDIHRIGFVPRGAARVWQALDRQPPSRIAINAGWTGEGMMLSISPLLGDQLQHTHAWITPTADGSVIDYRKVEELRARASYEAWLRRLHEQHVDIVACLTPPGVERWWIESHRDDFQLIAASDDGAYAAFRVKR